MFLAPRFNFQNNIKYHQPQLSVLSSKFESDFLNLNFVLWKQEMNISDNEDNLHNYCDMLLLPLIRSVLPSTFWYFSPECTFRYFLIFLLSAPLILDLSPNLTRGTIWLTQIFFQIVVTFFFNFKCCLTAIFALRHLLQLVFLVKHVRGSREN